MTMPSYCHHCKLFKDSPAIFVTSRALQKTSALSHRILQILLVVTLFTSTQALLGSDDEQAIQFNHQLLLQNQPVSKMKSRLATLLELKQSIKALMNQKNDLSREMNNIEDSTVDTNGNNEIVTEKRVFCNIFSGCGGKWRRQLALEDMRKRREKAAASKRPFCNTRGCFNGKRKKDETMEAVVDGKTYIFGDSGDLSLGTDGGDRSRSASKEKRLFCNGYGGCQNMGKRGLLLPLLVGRQPSVEEEYVVEKPTKPVFEITLEPSKEKRFFASSYDSKMDDFLSRINR